MGGPQFGWRWQVACVQPVSSIKINCGGLRMSRFSEGTHVTHYYTFQWTFSRRIDCARLMPVTKHRPCFFGGQHATRAVTAVIAQWKLSVNTSAMPYLHDAPLLCGGGLQRHYPPVLISMIVTGGAFPTIKRFIKRVEHPNPSLGSVNCSFFYW